MDLKWIKFKKEKPELSFSDLDVAYQNHFIKEYALAALLFIVSIVFCILIKQYWYILGCIALMAGYCLYLYLQIYRSLTNHVLVIDGLCIDIDKKENTLFGMKEMVSKTCTITIETEDGLKLTQSVPYAVNFQKGVTIRIYADEGTVSQLNQNTYTVINPIFMHVLAN